MFRKNKTVSYKGHIATIKSKYPNSGRYLIEFKNPYYGWPEEKIGPGRYYYADADDIKAYKPTNYDKPKYVQKIYDKYKELEDKNITLYKAYKRPGPVKKKTWSNLVYVFGERLTVMTSALQCFTCAICDKIELYDDYYAKWNSEDVFIYIVPSGTYHYLVRDGKIVCRL